MKENQNKEKFLKGQKNILLSDRLKGVFKMELNKNCEFCQGYEELGVYNASGCVMFDVDKLKECNKDVKYCPVCGKELKNE